MGFINTLFCLLIVIFIWSHSHVKATYVIHTAEYMKEKKCVMRLDVEGHGIDGAFYATCEDGRKLNIRAEDGRLRIGDRNDPVSAYSDKKGSLVVLDEAGKITKKIKSTNYELYKYYLGTTNEKPITCQRTLINWIRVTVSPKKTASPSIKKPSHADVVVIKSEMLCFLTNTCKGKIKVTGNGIKYEDHMACPQVQDRRVIFSPEGVILHDYRGAIQSVIVSQESVVTVNHDRSCNRMTSTNKDSQRENMVLMDIPSCSQTKEFVEQYLGVRVYRYMFKFVHDIMIRGRGLDHMLKGLSYHEDLETHVKYSAKCGVLLVGNYRQNSLSAFSDSPGTLVVLQGGGKNCTSHTYKEGEHASSEVMEEADCAQIKSRVDNSWDTIKYEEKGSLSEFSIVRDVSLVFHKNKNDGSTLTETFERVQLNVGGVNNIITESITTTDRLEQHTTPSGLVVCNYEKQDMCVVAEVKNMIIMRKDKCLRVTYEGVGENYNVRVADPDTCDNAIKKTTYYRNRKV